MDKKKNNDKETSKRILSPDELDVYIRVAKPRIWLVVISLLLLVTAAAVYAFTGSISETLQLKGVITDDGKVYCFVEISDSNRDLNGRAAKIITADGSAIDAVVTDISVNPYSGPEIADFLASDWLTGKMAPNGYAYRVTLSHNADSSEYIPGMLVSVTLILSEKRLIDFVFN